ncbi:hypothetical protein DFP72DRAFT_1105781, partial [Ephemerocybe angulata]
DSDSDLDSSYPQSLVDSAKKAAWDSPSKSSRVYTQPLKRRAKNGPTKARIPPQSPNHSGFGPSPDLISIDTTSPGRPGFTDAQILQYTDAFESYTAGFIFIGNAIFVCEGWDVQRGQCTASWYHLQYLWGIDNSLRTVCTCPQGIEDNHCIHQVFFKTFEAEKVLHSSGTENTDINVGGDSTATIFLRQRTTNGAKFTTKFSVTSLSMSHLKGRAIVTHIGNGVDSGKWKCSKDSNTSSMCLHVSASQKVLRGRLGPEGNAAIEEDDIGSDGVSAEPLGGSSLVKRGPISYRPVLPPLAASLKRDPHLYPRPTPFRNGPASAPLLKLDQYSSCPCTPGRTYYDRDLEVIEKDCKIYTLLQVVHARIQVQKCPSSPASRRRSIGPDLREMGIFNYNNSILVSHELLDEYTMTYAASETPFTAYVTVVSQRYVNSGSVFMGEDLFRSVWFAYATIQAFDNDFSCIRCGEYPDTTIWDGITLAFGKKHITGTLRPPTVTSDRSVTRMKIKNKPKQQLIADATLRKKMRHVATQPSLATLINQLDTEIDDDDGEEDDDSTNTNPSQSKQERQAKLLKERFELIDSISSQLTLACPPLAPLFGEAYGAASMKKGKAHIRIQKSFFIQAAAEESVLQLVRGSAMDDLRFFLSDPHSSRLSQIVSIPGIYNMVRIHKSIEDMIPLLRWILSKAESVLQSLTLEQNLEAAGARFEPVKDDDWQTTGCFYSLPRIRDRPIYPALKTDTKKEVSKPRGDRCGKHYSQYGESGFSGGIMAVWCTHAMCYGFHCIPDSEGRNDVFSALVSRWPKAPRNIIYDFACALGPYCMLREPAFFKDTLFAVDHFHMAGHTKCSPASSLSEYANADPALGTINSSAAECGNSGLKRIRKSVSYMSQERSVIYTKTFLSVRNRLRMR